MDANAARTNDATSPRAINWGVALAVLVGGAFALRLFYLNQIVALPPFDHPVGDSAIYLKRANEIASGSWLPTRPFFYGSMLYPYFLAGVLELSGDRLFWACFSQIV